MPGVPTEPSAFLDVHVITGSQSAAPLLLDNGDPSKDRAFLFVAFSPGLVLECQFLLQWDSGRWVPSPGSTGHPVYAGYRASHAGMHCARSGRFVLGSRS